MGSFRSVVMVRLGCRSGGVFLEEEWGLVEREFVVFFGWERRRDL